MLKPVPDTRCRRDVVNVVHHHAARREGVDRRWWLDGPDDDAAQALGPEQVVIPRLADLIRVLLAVEVRVRNVST
jgi:hypothetical protein